MKGNVSGYVCNHGSPSGERDTASPGLWAMLRTQASDEEADDVSSRRHLYCGTPVVTSWAVAGQQVVFFSYVSSDRVTLRAFPVATPRGRSVSFPTRGTMVTYVTWDVFYVNILCLINYCCDQRWIYSSLQCHMISLICWFAAQETFQIMINYDIILSIIVLPNIFVVTFYFSAFFDE